MEMDHEELIKTVAEEQQRALRIEQARRQAAELLETAKQIYISTVAQEIARAGRGLPPTDLDLLRKAAMDAALQWHS